MTPKNWDIRRKNLEEIQNVTAIGIENVLKNVLNVLKNILNVLKNVLNVLKNVLNVLKNVLNILKNILNVLKNVLKKIEIKVQIEYGKSRCDLKKNVIPKTTM